MTTTYTRQAAIETIASVVIESADRPSEYLDQ